MRPLEITVPSLLFVYLIWFHPRPFFIRLLPALAIILTLLHFGIEGYRWQMIPLYVLLRYAGLTDSLEGLTLIYVVWSLPFVLWMMHGYVKSIPLELEEAAVMDGASRGQVIMKVLFPLLLPAIGASALFAFISAWNEFFFALVLMKSPALATLQVELARYTGMEGQSRTGPLAAASIIATIPSMLVFVMMRKWFTTGLVSGALKG